MNIEEGTNFLETDIMVFQQYHLLAIHRNPKSLEILTALEAPDYQVVPYGIWSTEDSKLGYITGMFCRVEDNTTFRLHIAVCILEMVLELLLHRWPMQLIRKAIDMRTRVRRDGAYRVVSDIVHATLS